MTRNPSAAIWLLPVLLVAGCISGARPNADEIASQLRTAPQSLNRDAVMGRGYAEIDGRSGPMLRNGNCYERAQGYGLAKGGVGVDVVRVCLGNDPTQTVVFAMKTHGATWTEVYPNDQRSQVPTKGAEFNISAETRKWLLP